MEGHFNWLQLAPGVGHHYVHIASFVVGSVLAILMGFVAKASLATGTAVDAPASKVGLRALFEVITEFLTGLSDSIIGEEGRHYIPFFASVFTLILINNVMGLIPGMTPATDNINTTIGLGLIVFVYYNLEGVKANGAGYIKHFLGPVPWMAPFILFLELISHFVRPASLGLRLRGNMMGDHAVLSVFIDLTHVVVPVIFYSLGLFVCFIQAFVFTVLTMVYVSMAIAHEH